MEDKFKNRVPKKLSGSIYETEHASPGLLFWRAFYNWQRSIRSELDKQGITQAQYAVMAALSFLASSGIEVNQTDIARQLSMDKMMVSDLVKTLASKKFLTKNKHSLDARAFTLQLTQSGKEKLQICIPLVENIDECFFKCVGKNYNALLASLRILATNGQ